MRIEVGVVLDGFCGGYFGRDSYLDKRVEARGHDWIVTRNTNGEPEFACSEDGEPIDDALGRYVKGVGWVVSTEVEITEGLGK